MRRAALIVLSCVCLMGCGKKPAIVLIDNWWNVDYAKDVCRSAKNWSKENAALISQVGCDSVTSCKEMTKMFDACVTDESGGVGNYTGRLVTEMAAAPECNGVQIVEMASPDGKDNAVNAASGAEHWTLMFDFVPGADIQAWSLVQKGHVLNGSDRSITQIAKKVCTIAKANGGKAIND